ncbi:MAG: FGGY-family carbohydrate kinase [Chloroflexi bacterium]|nr:FGGY-family carbohydrate kinase [Chloroflexota bacterium]
MATVDLVLAVDVGSTWCKAAYLDGQGRVIATGRAPTRQIAPARNGTLEGFWEAFVLSVRQATSRLPDGSALSAVGISCRALFGVCLDRAGNGYLPAWDAAWDRSSPDGLYAYSPEVWGEKDPYAYGYATGFGALILWLRRTRPAEWQAIQRVGALHDYIVLRLTGVWVTDPTTGPGQYVWPDEIAQMTGLPLGAFPPIADPHCLAGGLSAEAAGALGLPPGTPVVVGMHDGAAANLGVGAIGVGDGCFTFGTNFVFRGVTGRRLTSRSMGYLITPGVWSWVGNIPGASAQFEMATQMLADGAPDVAARHAHLGSLADGVAPGAGTLCLRLVAPGREEELRQAVAAARQSGYSDGVIYRAILEAVALGEWGLVARAQRDGVQPRRLVATGGGAANGPFLRVLASVLDAPVEMGAVEGGLLGAGMAAAVGGGWYASYDDAVAGMSAPGPVIRPDPDAAAFYREIVHL